MKKIIFLVLAVIFAAGTLLAQNADKKWAIGLGPGLDRNLENEDDNFMGIVYVSRYLNPSFDLMLENRRKSSFPGFFTKNFP